MKKKTINLITLGCSKNLVDSEKVLGQLPLNEFEIMHDADAFADIVIINTCGFINDAKQESIDTILAFTAARSRGDVGQLYVMGCLSQRYKSELEKEIPEVDGWFGVDEPHSLFTHLRQAFDPASGIRNITTPAHYAYLKIAEGCDRTCSFCAIPMIRGPYRSVPIADLLAEARLLAAKGVKELILVAQDLSYYGRDMNGRSMLVDLIEALLKIREFEWIRLHYLYPTGFPEGLASLMASEPRVCNYLDMPLQHINDMMLKAMRRGHDSYGTMELIHSLRNEIPDLAIRTTLLVGFPGETEEIYSELKSFVKEVEFERLGVFAYSPEEGTRAFDFKEDVSESVRQKRASELMEIQQSISAGLNRKRIGKIFRVIIDREEADHFVGRTEFDSPEVDNEVIIMKPATISVGNFIHARVTSSVDYDLYAEVVNAL